MATPKQIILTPGELNAYLTVCRSHGVYHIRIGDVEAQLAILASKTGEDVPPPPVAQPTEDEFAFMAGGIIPPRRDVQ